MNKSEIRRIPKHQRHEVDDQGCWNWIGGPKGKGYGHVNVNGKLTTAHRFYFEHYVGVIESGNQVDHLCRNKRCVNPEHLESVTNLENVKRAHQATHCKDCDCKKIIAQEPTKKPKGIAHETWLEINNRKNANGCWIWLGSKNKKGIGMIFWPKAKATGAISVPRASYMHFIGEIPQGADIVKECLNTFCYNPAHLLVATQKSASRSAWDREHCGGCTCKPL
jgi:hypothetical protein